MPTAKKTPAAKPATKAAPAKKTATKPAEKPAKAATAIKLPKTLAQCADKLYEVRQQRLALSKQVEAMEREEAALREHLIANLPKSQASGIAGKIARASVETKTVVQVEDWDKLYGYMVKQYGKNKGIFSLLQRRVGDATVKEMWAAGKEVPGCKPFDVPVVSLNKL
jgi:hypothetical protein